MRTFSLVRNVADAALSGTAVIPATETPATSDKPAIAVKPRGRKLANVNGDKPAKAAKPGKAKSAGKPSTDEIPRYANKRYRGPSPVFRNHDRKLSPIVLDRVPGNFTDRDLAFIRDLHEQHAGRNFKRANCDAGNLSRAIGHKLVKHVSGPLDARDCLFALTPAGINRAKPVSATPAKR